MDSAHGGQIDLLVYTSPGSLSRTISIVEGDITRETTDAIVNAANADLKGGGGVDGAIHRAAGPELTEACRAIRRVRGPLERGEALPTTAGRLPATHVIHTAGPIWRGGHEGEESHLRDCYRNCLRVATGLMAQSIAFPALSCGVYGYPFDAGVRVGLQEMGAFLDSADVPDVLAIRFVFFGSEPATRAIGIAHELF